MVGFRVFGIRVAVTGQPEARVLGEARTKRQYCFDCVGASFLENLDIHLVGKHAGHAKSCSQDMETAVACVSLNYLLCARAHMCVCVWGGWGDPKRGIEGVTFA